MIEPSIPSDFKGTLVFFPSCSLLSSKEEWRQSATLLSSVGFRSMLFDWPGWHQRNAPLNWALEDDVAKKSLISTMTQFAYSVLKHVDSKCVDKADIHIVTAGGNGAVHVRRALGELLTESNKFKSLTCFAPSWRFYLTRYVPEGYPKKLARRRSIADWVLDNCFVRSATMFRIYRSKFGLAKIARRLYDQKLQHNADLFEQKREVIMRDRPLAIDAAMICGYFDPVCSSEELINELLRVNTSDTETHNDDSDDDDSLLNIKVPNWVKTQKVDQGLSELGSLVEPPNLKLHLVFPQDVSDADKRELDVIRQWSTKASYTTVSDMPGKIFCHEENPAIAATLIEKFLDNTVDE
jgi:hypothetical protein